MRAAEMGAMIRCSLVGDFLRETETAEPLTSTPEASPSRSRISLSKPLVYDRTGLGQLQSPQRSDARRLADSAWLPPGATAA